MTATTHVLSLSIAAHAKLSGAVLAGYLTTSRFNRGRGFGQGDREQVCQAGRMHLSHRYRKQKGRHGGRPLRPLTNAVHGSGSRAPCMALAAGRRAWFWQRGAVHGSGSKRPAWFWQRGDVHDSGSRAPCIRLAAGDLPGQSGTDQSHCMIIQTWSNRRARRSSIRTMK
jgi:hypothetical protein